MIFIERIIYEILDNAITRITNDTNIFKNFLINGGISEEEAKRQVTNFTNRPPVVVHNYARLEGPFPCFAIVLGGENNDIDYLGEDDTALDSDGEYQVDEDGNLIDPHIRRWSHAYTIFVYANHPDTCLYYYYLVKQILQESRSLMQNEDLDEFVFNGADLAAQAQYMPADMFARQFTIACKSDDTYNETFRPGIGLGRSIEGIHVSEDNEPNELGGAPGDDGVKRNITTYNTEED